MKRFAPLALVAALALAGCTAGNPSADATPSPTVTPSATVSAGISSSTIDAPSQDWASEKVNQFLSGNGANSFDAFKGQALGNIDSWNSTEEGVLNVHVSGDSWGKSDLLEIAKSFMASVGYESKDLEQVVVSSSNHSKVSYGRRDMKNANPWSG